MIFLTSPVEYEAAIRELDGFFANEPEPGSLESIRFVELLAAVDAYEAEAFPDQSPTDVRAVLTFDIGGLKCETPGCDFVEPTIEIKDFPEWQDRPCPNCGTPLLTETDIDFVSRMQDFIALTNYLSQHGGLGFARVDDDGQPQVDLVIDGNTPRILKRTGDDLS